MQWPLLGAPLAGELAIATSGWGSPRTVGSSSGIHGALDFAAARGTPVLAIADGRVVTAEPIERQYTGRYVLLEHTFAGGLKLLSRYIHLDSVLPLQAGQLVRQGQQIGTVGSTGDPKYSTHLHLDIRVCGASALADYKSTFGWPATDKLPALVSTPGCTAVPAEPLVSVAGYGGTLEREAKALGIPLARDRSLAAEASRKAGFVPFLIVGAVVVGAAVAGYVVWRSHARDTHA